MAAGGGGGDELKLLGLWASPYVLRAKFALSFKGLSYENVEEDLHNKSELLLSSNPVHKKVPVLIHNGKPICESQIIVEYVDEAFPDAGVSLLPSDPYDRAVARFWAAYINDKFMPAWQKASLGLTEEEKAEAVKQMLAAIENLETAFKELSRGKPFFGGDTAGYLDVTLGTVVGWARAGEVLFGRKLFDATRSPLLAAWMERFVALDAVKAVLPDNAELIEYGKMRMAHYAKLAAALAAANKKRNTHTHKHRHIVSIGGTGEMAGAGRDELKLLGMWASPYVSRAKLALQLKGVSYEYIEEDLGNKSDLFLRSNPVHKTVPVLIHNGNPICESSIIVQYIDESFPSSAASLLPADPYDRTVARFWAAYIDDKLAAPWRMVYRVKTEEERDELMKQTLAAVDVLEGGLKECSKGKGCFFGGDSVGYVDVVLGGLVSWVHASDKLSGAKLFDAAKAPLLAAWLGRFGELDAAKAVLQDVDKVVEYTKKFQPRDSGTAADRQAVN
ncbi:uncharacterized protein LOC127785946 [Oryza glaberrima]|uniref:uncharacterized protein LOC127785946 n=1 Tax=Oryza glaberrima TaxID=4538 RepID=UPI00224BEE52|nr:uncharacterized protein LOC127785946 [Oryza glaberrima]